MERPEAAHAYLGLGANVGDRLAALRRAVRTMETWPGTRVLAASPVYETEAHVLPGHPRQPDHLNAVVHLETELSAFELWARMQHAEHAAGRDRAAPPWSPRPLDLDLILYGSTRLSSDELAIPHPRLGERRFVLQPLADLAPDREIPGVGATVAELLARTSDTGRIAWTDHVLHVHDPA